MNVRGVAPASGLQSGIERLSIHRARRRREPVARRYEEAFAAYERRAWQEAREILASIPDDGPSRMLAARCAELLAEPPDEAWEAVAHSSSK